MAKSSTSFAAGNKANPRGRPAKTDDERAGETYLRDRTESAAKTLVELQGPAHEAKIRLGAVTTHLKITLGVLERQAGADGESMVNPLAGWTPEMLADFATWRLSLVAVATELQVKESPKT